MTTDEYRDALNQLGLSFNQAARFFDVDERTARRWGERDDWIPNSVAMLLTVMVHKQLAPERVYRMTFAEKLGESER
jgi:hypothetical protein